MKKSNQILGNVHLQIEVLLGAFPESENSLIREDIVRIQNTLYAFETELMWGN
jgi:hypothetical protein